MNIKQMKTAIAKFRKADLSVIKDEKLRAKAQQLQNKEKGFTLLELLVVITLIAILATGALVAYENIGESAEAAQAANTIGTLDRAIRTYRAVENVYPNQWDNLVDEVGSALEFAPPAMDTWLASWDITGLPGTADGSALLEMFEESGIEELQVVTDGAGLDDAAIDDAAPNRMHNESSGSAFEVELEDGELPDALAVVPSQECTTQSASLGYPPSPFDGTTLTSNELQNAYGDALEADECHALIALGFGGDAAASTSFSNVAIAQSPSYIRTTGDADTSVNPEIHYSRYIGLFHAAAWDAADSEWDWNDKLRLITIVAPDGKNLDQLVSEASQASDDGDDD
jgi:prepilin-type N-terminal cleavage/methylation domain-containing protein